MIKYIKVEWPDIQKFQELPNYENDCYEHESGLITFVPEDLYKRVLISKEIETNLGIITFEKYYAFAKNEFFWYSPYPNKGDILLIQNINTRDYKIVTCIASDSEHILTDDKGVAIGVFDELIGSYHP